MLNLDASSPRREGESTPLELTTQQVCLLADVGFVAIRRNRGKEALVIFEGIRRYRPHAVCAYVGIALGQASLHCFQQAEATLEHAPQVEPGAAGVIAAFLALVRLLAGDPARCAETLSLLAPDTAQSSLERMKSGLQGAAVSMISPAHPAWRRRGAAHREAI